MKPQFRHFLGAVVLHLALLGFLVSGVQCSRKVEPPSVIQGSLVDLSTLHKLAKTAPAPVEKPVEAAVEPTPPPAQPDPAVIQKQQAEVAEQARQQQLETQKKQEAAKAETERKQHEVLQKQQAEAKEAEHKAAELKQQAETKELERKAAEAKKQVAAEEAQRKADELKKQAAAEDAKRAEAVKKAALAEEQKRLNEERRKKELQAQIEAEQQRQREAELAAALGAEEQQNTSRDQNEWAGQLVAAITRAWNRVEGGPGLHCSVRINLSLTGEVLSATIAKSSGNIQFDNSAVRAVLKASPLPLPRNRAAFDSNVNLCFWPDNPNSSCK